MAGEVIDTLVVRLVGDAAHYKKTIKESKVTTDQFVRDANKRLREMSASFDRDLAAVRNSTKSTAKSQKELAAACGAMSKEVSGRMRDARGRFVSDARTMEAEAKRLGSSLRKVVGLAGRAGKAGGSALGGLRGSLGGLGGGLAAGIGGASVVGLATKSVFDASNSQETNAKFGAVFGEQTKEAGKFAEDLAATIGRSSEDVKQALSAYQSLFIGLDFGAGKSFEMSQQLEKLTLDFAAFHNITDEESMSRFISAMSGSAEVLDQFGVNIRQSAVENELFAMGINKSVQNASEAEKTLARLNVITKVMADQGALGAAGRESESFANQLKGLQAEAKDLSISIGKELLPIATSYIKDLKAIIGAHNDVSGSTSGVTTGFLTVADVLHTVSMSFQTVGVAFQFVQGKAISALAAITGAWAALVEYAPDFIPGAEGYKQHAGIIAEEMAIAAGTQEAEASQSFADLKATFMGKTPSERFAEAQAIAPTPEPKEISREFERMTMDRNIFQDAAESFTKTVTEAGQRFGQKAYWELFGIGNDLANWTKLEVGPTDSFNRATAGSAVRFGSAESEISRSQNLDDEMEKKTQKIVDNTEAQKRLTEKIHSTLVDVGRSLSTTSLPY